MTSIFSTWTGCRGVAFSFCKHIIPEQRNIHRAPHEHNKSLGWGNEATILPLWVQPTNHQTTRPHWDISAEISNGIWEVGNVFNSFRFLAQTRLRNAIGARTFSSNVLSATFCAYACYAKRIEYQLASTRRAIERSMLGIWLRDHIRKFEIGAIWSHMTENTNIAESDK